MFAVFRVGRQELSCNDIVVHGAVHINKSGRISGPVSRIACSILCSYDPPYECFIFAGSIDDSKVFSSVFLVNNPVLLLCSVNRNRILLASLMISQHTVYCSGIQKQMNGGKFPEVALSNL